MWAAWSTEKLFTGFSGSRQGSKALRLQEAKFGVPPFHDPRATCFQHSKFPGSKIPWTKGSILRVPKFKVSGKAWGFPVQVPDLQKLESSRVLEVQGCRFPWFQSSKISEFRGYRVPEQKPFAGDLAGIPCRKFCSNLSGRLNKTCGFSLSFVLLIY